MRWRFAVLLTAAVLMAPPAVSAPTARPPAACAVPGAQVGTLAAPLPRVAAHLEAGEPLRIVAIGSSSTAGAGASDADHSYPARLSHYLHQRFPGLPFLVFNKGVNGEVGPDMLRRFQHDVLDQTPDLVIWQVGANSVLRDKDPAEAEAVIRDGVKRLKAAGLDVVLMDLQYAPAMLERPGHGDMQARIARIAADEGVGLFRRFAVMRQWVQTQQASMSDLVGPDGIHQNDFGYDCIARALASSIQDAAGLATTGHAANTHQ
ncbi:SGNH/GDSL hydrolase family protein [Azospirillum sp. sgz301742]